MKLNLFQNKSLNTFLRYSFKYKWAMVAVILMSVLTSSMGAVPAWLPGTLRRKPRLSQAAGL